VADEPTYRLIPAFYRLWQQGNSKSAALRLAQLEVLRALRAGRIKIHAPSGDFQLPEDPVFWASFVLEGAP
jgi:CHAT domain-containing protein